MNLARIRSEFDCAQLQFSCVELNPTTDGKAFVKVALQPPSQQFYIASIYFPDSYPNQMPDVYITKPVIDRAPHRYTNGKICYLHPNFWNPGTHDLVFVIARVAKWLNKYEVWKHLGAWPGAEIKH